MSPNPAALYTIVVDPYDPHQLRRLRADKHNLIGVFSDFAAVGRRTLAPSQTNELALVRHENGDFAGLVASLQRCRVHRIYNGSELGSRLWVKLQLALTPDAAPSSALQFVLRNKFDTANFLREKGIPVPRNYVLHARPASADLARIARDVGFPAVFKPTMSAGSFGVRVCADAPQVDRAASNVFGTYDTFGAKIEQAVVEEKLLGREHVLCLATERGKHSLVAAYAYTEVAGDTVPRARSLSLEPRDQPHIIELQRYAEAVLDAMEFKFGQFAVEIMLTAKGPRLIELNARFGGFNGLLEDVMERSAIVARIRPGDAGALTPAGHAAVSASAARTDKASATK